MAFEYEALVGHLYVAGGRTIKTTPPGTLCEVAPRRAARGREIDTIFVLVLPSGTIAPNTFYEQMALMAAERYFSQGGSVTSALREVLNTLNHNLHEHNQSGRKHYEANMLVAVMRSEDLYVARVGAATMVLRHADGTQITVPANFKDDDALFVAPLGVQPIPEIEMNKYALQEGTRMIMSDANIIEITKENVTKALTSDNMENLLDDFKTMVTLQIQMMAVEFVPPDEPIMMPAMTGQSSAVLNAEIAAARSRVAAEQAAEQARVAETAAEQARINSPRNRLKRRATSAAVAFASSAGHFLLAMASLGGKLWTKEPTERRRKANSTIVTAAVFGIPAVLAITVLLSWVFNVGQTAFEQCVADAVEASNVARSIDSSVKSSMIAAWEGTERIVNECEDIRPDLPDPTLSEIRREAQAVLDRLNNISRRNVTALFPAPDANITSMIINGLDLYALDSTNNLVYRLQLTEDGGALASTPQPIPNMRIGARVEGYTIGRIVDIAFATETSQTQILALDENGVLISCLPSFINQCEAQQLVGTESWQNPIKLEIFGNNLYILDTGATEIWRYEPVGTTDNYANPPEEYFSPVSRPAFLTNAVDFVIGTIDPIRGRVFILYGDGTATSHFSGEPVAFAFGSFPDALSLEEVTAQAMYLTNERISVAFYFVSRPSRTIYKTSAGGSFAAAYRVFDDSLFERLNDVIADVENEVIYAASGNTIFAMREQP